MRSGLAANETRFTENKLLVYTTAPAEMRHWFRVDLT